MRAREACAAAGACALLVCGGSRWVTASEPAPVPGAPPLTVPPGRLAPVVPGQPGADTLIVPQGQAAPDVTRRFPIVLVPSRTDRLPIVREVHNPAEYPIIVARPGLDPQSPPATHVLPRARILPAPTAPRAPRSR